MKQKLILFAAVLFAGCVSLPPGRSTADWPMKAIVVPADQTITLQSIGHPTVTIPAGAYTLVYQNKFAWYYSKPDVVLVRKDMFTYRDNGGIGCDKGTGRIFFYRIPPRDNAGELVRYFAKKAAEDTDDVVRAGFGYPSEQDMAQWKFEAYQPAPAQRP